MAEATAQVATSVTDPSPRLSGGKASVSFSQGSITFPLLLNRFWCRPSLLVEQRTTDDCIIDYRDTTNPNFSPTSSLGTSPPDSHLDDLYVYWFCTMDYFARSERLSSRHCCKHSCFTGICYIKRARQTGATRANKWSGKSIRGRKNSKRWMSS